MNEGTPVAAGLAIGVTFIVAFSWAASLGTLSPSSSQEDARYFALKITRDLDEVKEFFGIYPNASTTVYFITLHALTNVARLYSGYPASLNTGTKLKIRNMRS
jgi:hypothetical protein